MIYTFTGRNVSPINLNPEDIDIRDIAHALACCNRFAGHAKFPISVAQHSVYASYLCVGTGSELQALLHDGSEAYMQDITKWVKQLPIMAGYREAEARAQKVIYRVFGCPEEDTDPVKAADNLLVRYELMKGFGKDFTVGGVKADRHKDYPAITDHELKQMEKWYAEEWTWRMAEHRFLSRFKELTEPKPETVETVGDWGGVWRGFYETPNTTGS